MEKINFVALSTSEAFEKFTSQELATITPEELGKLSSKQLELYLKAKIAARKKEDKSEKEQLAKLEQLRKDAEEKTLIESYTHKDTTFEVNGRFTNGTLYGKTDSGKDKSKYPPVKNATLENLVFTFLTQGVEAMEDNIVKFSEMITGERERVKAEAEAKAKAEKDAEAKALKDAEAKAKAEAKKVA